ncbi:MAG: transketolase C-terminal domain-containing protein [Deltaproteobacteria bacterium]|jgi:transketolase
MNDEIAGLRTKAMRDVFIEALGHRMKEDEDIFFLCADFGSPALDRIRKECPGRFINVGIAEQNLINVATGLALEGYTVYAYAIAPFITMRAYEQIRVNLALQSQLKELNVNLIGVGAGLSYDVSGPTHHCVEDITIMRALPGFVLFSPSDWVLASRFVDYSIRVKKPKYIRFEGKLSEQIYDDKAPIRVEDGFCKLRQGQGVCFISTGFMTRTALKAAATLERSGKSPGVIDVFLLKPIHGERLFDAIKGYERVITLEEGFVNKGGLDSVVSLLLEQNDSKIKLKRMGIEDSYTFDMGTRDALHAMNGIGVNDVVNAAQGLLK